jgi:hypothetical protein
MIAIFALRLAFGLLACLWLLSPAQVNPRFFRVHFLTALGLAAVAWFFAREEVGASTHLILAAALLLSFFGSVVWHLEGAPLGRTSIYLATAALGAVLILVGTEVRGRASATHNPNDAWLVADDFTSAAVLGASTTAMLMGHSYLIAPAMSLTPLLTLLGALGVSLAARLALAALGLWQWTELAAWSNLESELVLWLAVRWLVGFVGPIVLGWMAWETTRIRSTQSATGILYVVVILCFLGELTSQLLLSKTGTFSKELGPQRRTGFRSCPAKRQERNPVLRHRGLQE